MKKLPNFLVYLIFFSSLEIVAQPCYTSQIITTPITTSKGFKAITIISSNNITTGNEVNFQAGNSIQFNPGFQAGGTNKVFTAYIGDCNYDIRLVELFAKSLNDTLVGKDVGFSFAICQNDKYMIGNSGGQKARAIDIGGTKPFTTNTKMHIASMTKSLSTMLLLKILDIKNISLDNNIDPYLPSYWPRGINISQITFRQLLTHKSGIIGSGSYCNNGSYSENVWSGLKSLINKGISNTGGYCYQNANFGLLRVLIPSLMGHTFTGNETTDANQTEVLFLQYLQSYIFNTVNVNNVQPDNPNNDITYTYPYPYDGTTGWNQGNFKVTMGGYGIYLTSFEAAKIYGNALSSFNSSILSSSQSQEMLNGGLGCYRIYDGQNTYYYHDGWWYLLTSPPKGIRSIWMKFPNNITCVLFVNALKNQQFPFYNGNITGFLYNSYKSAENLLNGTATARKQYINLIYDDPNPH